MEPTSKSFVVKLEMPEPEEKVLKEEKSRL
jgi:hypothetical protein